MVARGTHKEDSRITPKTGGRLAPGQAPPVGVENKERATENLRSKLFLIEAWVKKLLKQEGESINEPMVPLAALPRSQRAFNAWTSQELPSSAAGLHGPFHKNSNSTLLKNASIHEVLLDYFEILNRAEQCDPARKKRENVESLHRRLTMEKTIRRIAEKELARARAQVWKSREELEALRASVASSEAYAAEMISKLETMLQQVTAERAELARALKNVVCMRPATK